MKLPNTSVDILLFILGLKMAKNFEVQNVAAL